jgi:hypothetical protein
LSLVRGITVQCNVKMQCNAEKIKFFLKYYVAKFKTAKRLRYVQITKYNQTRVFISHPNNNNNNNNSKLLVSSDKKGYMDSKSAAVEFRGYATLSFIKTLKHKHETKKTSLKFFTRSSTKGCPLLSFFKIPSANI